MRRGFTLVELSIVLVIIGLLIGGILAAQSMIETARIQNVIRQIQQVDIAVSNFKTEYNSLPGDSPLFTIQGTSQTDIYNRSNPSASCVGNGFIEENTNVGFGYGGSCDGIHGDISNRFDGEIANFYVQLGQTGFGNGNYSPNIPPGGFNSDPNNLNAPIVKGPKGNLELIPYPCRTELYDNCYQIADYKDLGHPPSDNDPLHYGAYLTSEPQPLKPSQAYAIDAKIDDGNAVTGAVRNWLLNSHGNGGAGCDNYDGSNAATATYNMAGNLCYMSIGILSQVPNN